MNCPGPEPVRAGEPLAILFDLGKVIVPFEFERGYKALESLCPYTAAEIPGRIRSTGLVPLLDTGRIEPRAFVEALAHQLDIRVTYEEFVVIWSSIFLPGTLIPEDLIEGLKQRYRLVLLSNTNALHFGSIRENYPILRHFSSLVLSYQVGMLKPDPQIYRHAAAQARCTPEQCLFIDDLPENIEGARQAGMQGILFKSSMELERELSARGVRWSRV